MRSLIIDDSKVLRSALCSIVHSLDFEVEVAEDGREGLDFFNASHKENNPFELIFLDLDMPNMRGEQTLHAIRSYEDNLGVKNVKVIIVSANTDSMKILELFKIGCEYYIKKPFLGEDVDRAIRFLKLY